MKIAILEDNYVFYEALSRYVSSSTHGDVHIEHFPCLDVALSAFSSDRYDFFIADRNVPAKEGGAASKEHGDFAISEFCRVMEGAPVLVLSGHNDTNITELIGRLGCRGSLWGGVSNFPMVQYSPKEKMVNAITIISTIIDAFAKMKNIEVEVEEGVISSDAKHAIRVFCNQQDAVRAVCSPIGGGLSGSQVIAVTLYNFANNPVMWAVCKVGVGDKISRERDNFQGAVQRLSNDIYANLIDNSSVPLRNKRAIFYNLLNDYPDSYFRVLWRAPKEAAAIVEDLKRGFASWAVASVPSRISVKEIRRLFVSDDDQSEIVKNFGLQKVDEFERRDANIKTAYQHCDMHGENVLVSSAMRPKVIDFGDVSEATVCFDPVYLELSLLFHPSAAVLRDNINSEIFDHWLDVDIYCESFPFPDFVRACRAWADNVKASYREFLATAYSICMKQLKYPDTDKQIITRLIAVIVKEGLD